MGAEGSRGAVALVLADALASAVLPLLTLALFPLPVTLAMWVVGLSGLLLVQGAAS